MGFRHFCVVAAALVAGGVSNAAVAAPVSFREGLGNDYVANYAGTADTTLYSVSTVANWANSNAGGSTFLLTSGSSNRRRTIIRFDLSALGGLGATVSGDATLVLTKASGPATVTTPVVSLTAQQILPANAGWNEGNGPNDPTNSTAATGEATWNNKAHASTAWAGSAGLGTLNTDLAPAFFTGTFDYGAASGTAVSITVPASLVQSWIDAPTDNAGVFITTVSPGSTTTATFASSENATEAWRPTLSFDATVPEPATLGVLALAAPLLLRRRQRC